MPLRSYALPPLCERNDLFEAARLCARALALPASCRFILDQMCSVYGGELIEGRVMVWPSNRFLVEKTGLAERTVRLCVAQLRELGILATYDSPNGKRYVQRSRAGEIQKAYGFDLSPLLARVSEFKDRVIAQEDEQRDRKRAFDEVTIHRRTVEEALKSLLERSPGPDTDHLCSEAAKLAGDSPTRSTRGSPYAARDLWRKLREEVEILMKESASDGRDCRHKEEQTNPPESPCNKRGEEPDVLSVLDVLTTCKDAMALMGAVRSEQELIEVSDKMRGMLGVSRSAWSEALGRLGPLMASLVLAYVVQIQAKPAPGSKQISNLGGYFRAMCRKVAAGEVSFEAEVIRLRRRMT